MHFASGSYGGRLYRTPLQLSGLGVGDEAVSTLQQALINLSQATLRPLINPGPVTGEVNDQTMQALVQAMDLLTQSLPTWASIAVRGGLILGASSTPAKNIVAQHAPELTAAAIAETAKYRVTTPTSPILTQPTDWYRTSAGVVIIGGVLLLAFRLFFAPPST